MLKCLMRVVAIAVLLWSVTSFAYGQKATEMYIPLGQSPGLSGKYTLIGVIEKFNVQEQTISVVGPSGTRTVKITNRTKIWLDRSKLKLTNLKGSSTDLKIGRRVEVMYEDYDRKEFAEWVKVQITENSTERGAPRE
ncbi:MAG: hypothetical protein ACREIQ_03705 [Nitrospiria bacterium]